MLDRELAEHLVALGMREPGAEEGGRDARQLRRLSF
jgi:hypothetical protein